MNWLLVGGLSAIPVSLVLGAIFIPSASTPAPDLRQRSPHRYGALVIGASGAVGDATVRALLANPSCERVVTVGRSAPRVSSTDGKLKHVQLTPEEMLRVAERPDLFAGVDRIFSCMGSRVKYGEAEFRRVEEEIPVAFARAGKALGVGHVSTVSSLGADSKSKIMYTRLKGEAEEGLVAVGMPRTSIFRPSLIITPRNESRPAEFIAQKLQPVLFDWLLVGGMRKYRSITADDIAAAMIANAEVPAAKEGAPLVELFESNVIQQIADGSKAVKRE